MMNREYVFRTLKEEHLWKEGESDTFKVTINGNPWVITLRREESIYEPYRFSLKGKHIGTNETWSRRYVQMEKAFLHILNNFNENANVKDKYKHIEEWLFDKKPTRMVENHTVKVLNFIDADNGSIMDTFVFDKSADLTEIENKVKEVFEEEGNPYCDIVRDLYGHLLVNTEERAEVDW